jgi:hypothetical protein
MPFAITIVALMASPNRSFFSTTIPGQIQEDSGAFLHPRS